MTKLQKIKRAYKVSLTYGIGDGSLTKRERRFYVTMLYILSAGYSYYMLKDTIRTQEQGEFSLIKALRDEEQTQDDYDIVWFDPEAPLTVRDVEYFNI